MTLRIAERLAEIDADQRMAYAMLADCADRRRALLLALRELGYSWRRAGAQLGISGARAYQITHPKESAEAADS